MPSGPRSATGRKSIHRLRLQRRPRQKRRPQPEQEIRMAVTLDTTVLNADNSSPNAKSVQVTERALVRIRSAMEKEGISSQQGGLRLGVQGGGCSGLSYNIRFDTQPRERDRVFTFGGVRIFVDPKSFIYLSGMILDYENTLMKQGFNFVNPNASRSCGCGSSFSA